MRKGDKAGELGREKRKEMTKTHYISI